MFDFSRIKHYYIACGYTDMRKQFGVLAALVQMYLGREMEGASLHLPCRRRTDLIKTLYYAGTGHILLCKSLTEKQFQLPQSESELRKLTQQEFCWLMEVLTST